MTWGSLGLRCNIPWHFIELLSRKIKYHRIPWKWEGVISNYTNVPWDSMEYCMEFHGTLVTPHRISPSSMEFHGTFRTLFSLTSCSLGLPWNYMELEGLLLKWHRVPWNSMKCSMEFHGTFAPGVGIPWNLVLVWSSMEHLKFHGIPWNFYLWFFTYVYVSANPLLVEILRDHNSKTNFGTSDFA